MDRIATTMAEVVVLTQRVSNTHNSITHKLFEKEERECDRTGTNAVSLMTFQEMKQMKTEKKITKTKTNRQ